MSYIIDFLNFGSLPFVGRNFLTSQIIGFWKQNSESRTLRTALLEGEAGVGKTRLIETVIPQIVAQKGICVHIKLYPESTASLYLLLAQALDESSAREIIKSSTKPFFNEIISNLRRISRIRNTIIFIEDAHLISIESKRDLGNLLESLSNEVISVVFLSRPVEMPVRDLIDLYKTESWFVSGLSKEDIYEMWKLIFNYEPDPNIIEILNRETKGNSLALKSSLRTLVNSDAITEFDGNWMTESSLNTIERIVIKSTQLVADAMAFNLDDDELNTALKLATLGEVFSMEAASYLIENSEINIKKLKFRGLIVDSHYSAKILSGCKKSEYQALAFTHSLVHENLLKKSLINVEKLCQIISESTPLYSVIPFDLLSKFEIGFDVLDPDLMKKTFYSLLDLSYAIDETTDWKLAPRIFKPAENLLVNILSHCDEENTKIFKAEFLGCSLNLSSREMRTDSFEANALEFKNYTSVYKSTRLAALHIKSLIFYIGNQIVYKGVYSDLDQNWEAISKIVKDYPDVRYSIEYLDFVREFIKSFNQYPFSNVSHIKSAINEYKNLIKDNNLEDSLRIKWIVEVGSNLLLLPIENIDTLNEREKFLIEIDSIPESRNADTQLAKARFLYSTGNYSQSTSTLALVANLEKAKGQNIGSGVGMMLLLICKGFLGLDYQSTSDGIFKILEISNDFKKPVFYNLLLLFLVRNWDQNISHFISNFYYQIEEAPIKYRFYYAAVTDKIDEILNLIKDKNLVDDPEFLAITTMISKNEISNEAKVAIDNIQSKPIFLNKDFIDKILLLKLMGIWEKKKRNNVNYFTDKLKEICIQITEWSLKSGILPVIENVITNFSHFFDKDNLKFYKSKVIAFNKERNVQIKIEDTSSDKLKICLFGTISVTHPKKETHKLRGERIRYCIGGIVANHLMKFKLELDEFNSIVTGEDIPELGKTAMRTVRHRLRELLGDEPLILTDGEPMRFNLEIADVDIIDAFNYLKNAKKDLKNNKLNNAANNLIKVYNLIDGGVSFPGLYSNFFESLREDWENSLREITNNVCKSLLEEQDFIHAEAILEQAVKTLIGDEELSFLYEQTLIKQSKSAEAEIVMMKNDDY